MTARGPPSLPAHLTSSKEHFHWGHKHETPDVTARSADRGSSRDSRLGGPRGGHRPPHTATGSFTQVSFVPSNDRVAGGVLLFDFSEADVLTGDLSGTSVLEAAASFVCPRGREPVRQPRRSRARSTATAARPSS